MARERGGTLVGLVAILCLIAAACTSGGSDGGDAGRGSTRPITACDWPMWGAGVDRTFTSACETEVTPESVDQLRLRWFFNTDDVVTSTPAVVGDTLYVGDWSGKVYALSTADGRRRWTFSAPVHEQVYSGQIVGSPAVADVRGGRTVYIPSGKTLYALRASDGSVRWKHELGRPGDGEDPTEIETSPVVVDGTVYIGWDVHNSGKGEPAGVLALDAVTGRERWKRITAPTTGEGATGLGCADVWTSPTVDRERGLVFVGTANCIEPARWGRFHEAIVALDMRNRCRGAWTYQPPPPRNKDDLQLSRPPPTFF